MDAQSMQQATQEAVKKKFGKKRTLVSKVVPRYPQGLEREYIRVMNSYMALFKKTLAEHLPEVRVLLEQYSQSSIKHDAADDDENQPPVYHTGDEVSEFSTALEKVFDKTLAVFNERQGSFDLQGRIEKLSKLTRKLTINEWKRVVKRTLGIDIMEDYYNGLKFQQIFDKWVADNVGLIKTIPQNTLQDMRNIVSKGYIAGRTNASIAKDIQTSYGTSRSYAQFAARDQMAKLNAQITREQQNDAGVTEYVWRTANDGRVRPRHARLNNKRFKYSDPPVVDDKTGRRANPGEDYQCRCVSLPVFDIEGVVLPWEKGG